MILRRTTARTIGVLILVAALTVACTRSNAPTSTPTAPASSAASALNGQHVRVIGLWSGPELDSFVTVKSAWEKVTGGVVDWQASHDLPGDLDADRQAGSPPDIAVLPNLELLHQLARDGRLVALEAVLDMDRITQDYAPAWLDLGGYNGKLYGIFYKVTNKATVWYDPKAFAAAGYNVPTTWDELTALADRMVADGRTPFSIVAASGPGSGWPLTDWVSEIVLNNCGPDLYDKWVAAEVPWTDGCVKQSFAMFDAIVQAKGYVLGGSQRIRTTTDASGADPLYTNPPTAYLYYLASFAQAFIASHFPNLRAGEDYGFFPFPAITPQYGGAVTIGADVVVMTHNTPAARSFMAYLAGAQAQEAWIRLGGFTSVNRSVPMDTYADPVARAVAQELTDAKVVRFGAGDMMPSSVQRAWWGAMLELLDDPGKLDSILASMTSLAQSAR